MSPERSAGAVVFYAGEPVEYLLLLSTYWGFPKGHVESGEGERTAALREIREESGLDVTLLDGFRFLDEYWYQRRGQRTFKRTVYFLGQASSRASVISREHEDMVWLPYDAAMERLHFEGLREALRKANEFLASAAPGKSSDDA